MCGVAGPVDFGLPRLLMVTSSSFHQTRYESCDPEVELAPAEDHRGGVDLGNAGGDALFELSHRGDAYVSQKRAHHFRERELNQIEPRAMLGRVNVLESSRARMRIGHRFLRNVRRVAVQHNTNNSALGVVRIKLLEQADEFDAAVEVFNISKDVAAVQVNGGKYLQRAVTKVFILVTLSGELARHRGQTECGLANGLHARLLIDADGVDGVGPRVMNRIGSVDRDISIDHQYFLHLAVEVWVALCEVVAKLVKLDFVVVVVEEAPHCALASLGQACKSLSLGLFAKKSRQRRNSPQISREAVIFGLAASYSSHPSFSRIGDVELARAVMFVLQSGMRPGGQYFVDTPIDHPAAKAKLTLKFGNRGAVGITEHHLGPLNFASGGRSGGRKLVGSGAKLRSQYQRVALGFPCHAHHRQELNMKNGSYLLISNRNDGANY
jgi:hypothetical protein